MLILAAAGTKLLAVIALFIAIFDALIIFAFAKQLHERIYGEKSVSERRLMVFERRQRKFYRQLKKTAHQAARGETRAELEYASELKHIVRLSQWNRIKNRSIGVVFFASLILSFIAAVWVGKHYTKGTTVPVPLWIMWLAALFPYILIATFIMYVLVRIPGIRRRLAEMQAEDADA